MVEAGGVVHKLEEDNFQIIREIEGYIVELHCLRRRLEKEENANEVLKIELNEVREHCKSLEQQRENDTAIVDNL